MKVSLGLPTHRLDRFSELANAEAISEISVAAQESKFDAVFVTEHPFPSDDWLANGGHHALDPFVALAFAAATTTSIRLETNLCIAAYRNPFLLAKSVATLDALSGGRVILGLGAGYMDGEFAALGADFANRNEITDEAIKAMRQAWQGESVTMTGLNFVAAGNTMLPKPATLGGPPIWIGGNATKAMRRAVELADGWVPMPNSARTVSRLRTPALETLDDLHTRIQKIHALAVEHGRTDPLEIVFMPLGLDMFTNAPVVAEDVITSIRSLAEVGVTYITTSIPGDTRSEFLSNVEIFRDEVLPAIDDLA